MTIGEAFLDELGHMGTRYMFFSYDQHQHLKAIDSLDGLRAFLEHGWRRPASPENDPATIARHFSDSILKTRGMDLAWVYVVNVATCPWPYGFYILPIVMPAVCLWLAVRRRDRLQYTLRDMLGLTTLVAVVLSYQISLAALMPADPSSQLVALARWYAGILFAALCSAVAYWVYRRVIWVAICFTLIVEIEALRSWIIWLTT